MKKISFLTFGIIFGLLLIGNNLSVFASGTPVATNVAITGTPNVGQILTGVYTYGNTNITWDVVGGIWFSLSGTVYTSIAIDNNNIPYVAYMDLANSSKVTVMKFNWTNRITVWTPGFSSGNSSYESLVIDNNNIPYVAYRDQVNSGKVTVMKFNWTNWEIVGIPGFSSGDSHYVWLAIDNNNVPYVAYRDDTNWYKATVMKFNGTSWEVVGMLGFSPGLATARANYVSLAIDKNNTPYIAYSHSDATLDVGGATVMKFNGINWETVWTPRFSPGKIGYTSLSIDSNNTPYIAYTDNTNFNRAIVMKYSWTNWEFVWTPDFSADQVYFPSLSIDNNNIPYIAYVDYGSGQKSTVMKFNWTNRITVGPPGFSSGVVAYTSLTIDNNNNLYVVYDDQSNWDKATVMKFYSDPEGISTYKWYRDNTEITWATTKTYSILSSDQGKTIKFEITPVSLWWMSGVAVQSTWLVINTESSGWWWGGWGSWNPIDNCPDWDYSDSYYDWICNASKITICHVPPGNVENMHEIVVYANSASYQAHMNHWDYTWVCVLNRNKYSQEFSDAYNFAYHFWITTKKTIEDADLEWRMIRSHMTKMIVNYSIKVMSWVVNTWRQCEFDDIEDQSEEMKAYITLSCQLGIMWIGLTSFNPNWLVTRAEFGTVLSRVLYGETYNGGEFYYSNHLKILKEKWIIKNDDPGLEELRWYVMLMLMRAGK